eukprot:CAMPEP_0119358692 /NCGR_PEP_ID=MMETSP1334-20130426/6829_1 /TAXON_ID=127549 /ORGANISM="Calcidiscus leptoporus, Strain RCC1130" /LENGTH=433 /DNA_ID=CAMNT_0007373235 /DNA_START=47 /DNA_END=1348 /DNA_ORIENTATION=-
MPAEPQENMSSEERRQKKKTDANRRKKERRLANARVEKAKAAEVATIDAVMPTLEAVAAGVASAPGTMRSERRDAGEGRGFGMFATAQIGAAEEIASTVPALSVVFDESAADVCGFCFACEEPNEREVAVVLQRTDKGFGLILDDRPSAGNAALIAGVVKDGPNGGEVLIGDRLVSIDGVAVEGGHEGAIKLLRSACERLGDGVGVPCLFSRPGRVFCAGCNKLCACAGCVKAGRLDWHKHECQAFQALPQRAKAGSDTSVLRLLLRFRMTQQPEIGDWCDHKETTTALTSLQRNPLNLDRTQLATLAALAGVSANDAGAIISMVRTNACQVERNGKKAGCALSALVGWHNHDCAPNAAATVMEDGRIGMYALTSLQEGAEVLISYVDTSQSRTARNEVLSRHYGFECRCDRCKLEQRASLKTALKESQHRRR